MKMKCCVSMLWIILFSFTKLSAGDIDRDIQIIPKPQKMTVLSGKFVLTPDTYVVADQDLVARAEQLRAYLTPATGYLLPVKERMGEGRVFELKLDDGLSTLGEEGYIVNVSTSRVLISSSTPLGIFWGIQTLRQLLPSDILREAIVENVKWELPCVEIEDRPRFQWRGLMIDYSRTFWNKSHTKKYIDALSFYKMNKLHMHLTDDQGWRIEIEAYPDLTGIASKFDTLYHEPGEREGYYSQDDIRELVSYAAARNVEIIPEIEMPGHTTEVFAAYPELSCNGDTLSIHPFFEGPGIHNEIFCAGKEETFTFLENVLSEIAELFPSTYVHIGGDEAPKVLWESCADCQRVIKENGLKDEHELQSWFVRRIENFLKTKHKKLVGWDEIIEGGLSKTATVMYWRGWKEDAPVLAVNQGNDVIMSPTSHCYFDYTYEQISTEKVFFFEPLSGKLEHVNPKYILGVQANFWSHIDRTEPAMDRQVFPRVLALAEVGWTDGTDKNWDHFKLRLDHHKKSLSIQDIYYMED